MTYKLDLFRWPNGGTAIIRFISQAKVVAKTKLGKIQLFATTQQTKTT